MPGIKQYPYSDILNRPHHRSRSRPGMSMSDRAAQFSPFAALVGYDEAVKETARLTDRRIELDESQIEVLNGRLLILSENIRQCPEADICYFLPDERKAGGAYITVSGKVKKIDEYTREVVFLDGRKIPIPEIIEIQIKEN